MQTILSSVGANHIIRYKDRLYRTTENSRAMDYQGQLIAISPEAEVEIVKTPADLAKDYLGLVAPLQDLGNTFVQWGNQFNQQLEQAKQALEKAKEEADKQKEAAAKEAEPAPPAEPTAPSEPNAD